MFVYGGIRYLNCGDCITLATGRSGRYINTEYKHIARYGGVVGAVLCKFRSFSYTSSSPTETSKPVCLRSVHINRSKPCSVEHVLVLLHIIKCYKTVTFSIC